MEEKSNLERRIGAAHHLDGTTDSLTNFYADWAAEYDKDVAGLDYTAIDMMVSLLLSQRGNDQLSIAPFDKDIRIVDVGCGTGLLGQKLHAAGFTHIDGVDLSQEMVDQANKRGAYQHLLCAF